MQVFHTVDHLQEALSPLREGGQKIGFVPTMGALHSGHLNLINAAQKQSDIVVVSIFVNPTQFNNPNDLANYPRVPEKDLELLEKQGVNIAFLPSVEEMYPNKTEAEHFDLKGLDTVMEGAFRPGHFKGVATIVKRFFEIVRPHCAFFGQKDFQQLQVIRALAQTLKEAPEIIGVETQRSDKGLALSSRNELLNTQQKEQALLIYDCLHWAQEQVSKLTPAEIEKSIEARFENSPLRLEYVQIADEEKLLPISNFSPKNKARIFLAAYAGDVRLIDNVSLI